MIYNHDSSERLFFTSDNHFSHQNILAYTNRPFDTVEAMDMAMIERWNEVVPARGLVYHLGDLTLGDKADHIFSELNGDIHFLNVHWHHDKRWLKDSVKSYSTKTGIAYMIGDMAVINIGGQYVHLSHYPLAEWDRKYHGAWHFHGHSHGNYRGDCSKTSERCIDVGVDSWNFYPASWEQIRDTIIIYEDDGNFQYYEGKRI